MNPDAEETIAERYRNAKSRLRNDLKDQLQTRMETLDEQHESLEYTRELVDLSGTEAKACIIYLTYFFNCRLLAFGF